jgi:hypothetical protein
MREEKRNEPDRSSVGYCEHFYRAQVINVPKFENQNQNVAVSKRFSGV